MTDLDLLSTSQAADVLGVTVKTVNQWAAEERLRVALKLPGTRGAHLFERSEVERLAADRAKADA